MPRPRVQSLIKLTYWTFSVSYKIRLFERFRLGVGRKRKSKKKVQKIHIVPDPAVFLFII